MKWREKHCDELGHLNHVQAVEYLERAREHWYRSCGLEWSDGFGTIVVNIDFNYRLECFVGDQLTVITRPLSMGTKSLKLGHQILRSDGRVAVDGEATSVVMDLQARQIIAVPDCLAEHLPKRQ